MAFTSKTTPDMNDKVEPVNSYWDALLGSSGFKKLVEEQYAAYMGQGGDNAGFLGSPGPANNMLGGDAADARHHPHQGNY